MTRRQLAITITAVIAALVLGAGVTLLATSGGDDQSVSAPGDSGTTEPTTATVPPVTSPPTTPPTTAAPVTAASVPPGTVVVNPPPSTAAPTTRPPPTTIPTTTKPPVTTTTRPSTSTTAPDGGGSDIGITPTEIHLAVISDNPDSIAGTKAWVEWVNKRGGIAGRKIRLDVFETQSDASKWAAAVKTACTQDFAIVGSLASADGNTTELERCGIPDLPARTISDAHGRAVNTFAVVPARVTSRLVGGYKWLLDNVDTCCAQYAILPTEPGAQDAAMQLVEAANSVGFTLVDTTELTDDATQADYAPAVQAIQDKHATLAWSLLDFGSTVNLRKEAAAKNVTGVSAWLCLDQCYTRTFITDGGPAVNSQYVQIEVNPFEESKSIPAMKAYIKYSKRDGVTPSTTGVESFAAGMLFEQAARQVVTDQGSDALTRVALIGVLNNIHDFTAGGILGATDVANGDPNGCFALLQVRSGKFARVYPTTRATLSCGRDNLLTVGP